MLIAAAMLIWSTGGVFVRVMGVDVPTLMFYSFFISALVQSLMFIKPGMRKELPSPGELPRLAVLSAIALINAFTLYYAYSATSISNAIFTHYIAPVLVVVLARIFLKESITARCMAAIAFATAGLWIMLGGVDIAGAPGGGIAPGSNLSGILAGLVSGVAYAVIILMVKVFTRSINPYVLVFVQNVIMSAALLPFAHRVTLDTLWKLAALSLMHSTLAAFLYYRGLKYVQANRAAILGYIEPLGAIMWGMVFLGEMPGASSLIGGVLIVLSGWMVIQKASGNGQT
jgi:drug/metabolite transporter (DMT)-like permease